MRYWPPDEIRNLASRIAQRAESGRVSRISPETAELIAAALLAYAARPARPRVVSVICGKYECRGGNCITCIGKANTIDAMYRGPEDTT